MARSLERLLTTGLLLSTALLLSAAPTPEKSLFEAAQSAFRGGFWDRAEKQFAEFAQTYPNSPDLPEAYLDQAEARIKQGNYAGAIALLSANQSQAGKFADEYLFWIAEAQFHKPDLRSAADAFAKLQKQFPGSSRCLEAAVEEASARSQLQQWPAVMTLLSQPNGVFQSAARTNAANEHIVRGYFLLSKASLATGNYTAAERALEPLANLALAPADDWQRQYLLCSIQLADGRAEEALRNTTNLLALAAKAGQPGLQAETVSFQAGLFEKLGRPDQAVACYSQNLSNSVPAELQARALVRIAKISLAQNRIAEAAETLERFLAQMTNAPNVDLAWLALGELRLRQHMAELDPAATASSSANTNSPSVTNHLQQALTALTTCVTRFPQSPSFGKAQLDLGWCYWLQTNMPEAQIHFQVAIERLPAPTDNPSALDQATAYFKLADTQFSQTNFVPALANYSTVVDKFAGFDPIKTNLLEPALYQVVRAAQKAGNLPAATNALAKIFDLFPKGFYTDRAYLLTGQEVGLQNPASACEIYSHLLQEVPDAPMRAELELAIARTYEQQNQWSEAARQYDHWLATFTNNPARPAALYYRAYANFRSDNQTNALTDFTSFVTEYPSNTDLTPRAQLWIADFYYGSKKWVEAEQTYKSLFQNSKNHSELGYQALMMAGRAAAARYDWQGATNHFITLAGDTNCPLDLRIQAMFGFGDALTSIGSETNNLDNLRNASAYFQAIGENYPTNRLAPLAWGRMADCNLQMRRYDLATLAYEKVIDSPLAEIGARSAAKIGLATILKKQAEEKSGEEQTNLLRQALDRCLDVFYPQNILRPPSSANPDGEKADPFWTLKAGLEAAALAETLHEWDQAIGINRELARLLPGMKEKFERNIQKSQEQSAHAKQENLSVNQTLSRPP